MCVFIETVAFIAEQERNHPMSTSGLPLGNDSSNKQRHVRSFHVGYYQLHPDVSLNYQMNRFSTGEADMIGEMRAVVPRIHDYT